MPNVVSTNFQIQAPTLIMLRQFDAVEDLNERIATRIREASQTEYDHSIRSTTYGGWQSGTDWLARDEDHAREMMTLIQQAANDYIVQCLSFRQRKPDMRLQHRTWGWVILSGKGAWNGPHVHPDATLSGVYYVKGVRPGEEESWTGGGSRQGCIEFLPGDGQSIVNLAPFSPAVNRTVPPVEGLMIVFPSHCYHFVYPQEVDEERMCVAFNIKILDHD